ncbi:MAG TPA: pyridoxal-phosphate dependent enzyme [Gemmatimonadaceae bacterium]|nr:pyridoxal-phosphate dependent enzyme [Gemmatimonadaceae bacterium]
MPLLRRFPALRSLPRAELGRFPTPVERIVVEPGVELWVKRDDLAGSELGGNKLRTLEFLLGGVRPGDIVLTAGGVGSTHVFATAHHARALGARAEAVRWRHDMNPAAHEVAERAGDLCERVQDSGGPVRGLARALLARARSRAHWVPLGGSSPLGILGHVNAALELVEQVERGELPLPTTVVVPLGTGGTAAGLALGFSLAGLPVTVVGARVVPRIAGNRWRVLRLADATARLLERLTGERVRRVDLSRVHVVHDAYGGAYGRALARAEEGGALAGRTLDVELDDTYSAKAFAAALSIVRQSAARHDRGTTLFWLTFDARWMETRRFTGPRAARVTGDRA